MLEMNKEALKSLIPHRGQALMIDRVIFDDNIPGRIIGYKKILADDPRLEGHFPPPLPLVYPGYCLIECCNLTALALVMILIPELDGTPMIARISKTNFRLPALVGDELRFLLTLKERVGNSVFIFDAAILNQDDKVVAEFKNITGVNNTGI